MRNDLAMEPNRRVVVYWGGSMQNHCVKIRFGQALAPRLAENVSEVRNFFSTGSDIFAGYGLIGVPSDRGAEEHQEIQLALSTAVVCHILKKQDT